MPSKRRRSRWFAGCSNRKGYSARSGPLTSLKTSCPSVEELSSSAKKTRHGHCNSSRITGAHQRKNCKRNRVLTSRKNGQARSNRFAVQKLNTRGAVDKGVLPDHARFHQ